MTTTEAGNPVKHFRKTADVEAIQLTRNQFDACINFVPGEQFLGAGPDFILIRTLEGKLRANQGDWLIRGVQGEVWPCRADIFEATYELAEPKAVT